MKIRNKSTRGKRATKAINRRRIRRAEKNAFEVKRDTMIGAACRRGWGAGYATV